MNIDHRFTWFLVPALLLGFASCGGSADYGRNESLEPVERENPVELESEQLEQVEELDRVLASTEPDCSTACDLSTTICSLSERICGIAERHPNDEATGERCRDASERCDGGRERVAESCTCAAP